MSQDPEYRVLFAVDVQRSAGRGSAAQQEVRRALFAALRDSLQAARIRWDDCHREDRGDGMRIVVPQRSQKASMIHPVALELALRLRNHNALRSQAARIKLRAALHAGDVFVSDGQLAGGALEFVARMLEAPPARQALDQAPHDAPLALVISRHVYDETVGHGYPGIDREAFRKITFQVKETVADAWLTLPGLAASGLPQEAGAPRAPSPSPSPGAAPQGAAQITNYKSPMHNGIGNQTVHY